MSLQSNCRAPSMMTWQLAQIVVQPAGTLKGKRCPCPSLARCLMTFSWAFIAALKLMSCNPAEMLIAWITLHVHSRETQTGSSRVLMNTTSRLSGSRCVLFGSATCTLQVIITTLSLNTACARTLSDKSQAHAVQRSIYSYAAPTSRLPVA